ncbi:glutamate-cysteine ligase [Culex quinquefasciatus]|uniref:Glutamate--cysteine ligase n=1 Tax=Culex quinquefasciatus TaxID=7176 RepID=B0WXU0_CULQU|nr:glutamate--cysteine ligase [Culex quinquefasciatus]XP_039433755.1 glutamate--cysteine ligase [Culex pipiens pallens]EDS36750.1 glutamate-cysteine ligase [Culex quinquefasciatus]|eukprot:XP_001862212.1 glutamate-cysteine ligase [Culex quinquefasciatus]
MGLLSEGSPLSWEETKALAQHVREHGIEQFINMYARLRDRQGDMLKWGDEVEYIIVRFDDEQKAAQVSLRAREMLAVLNEKEAADPQGVKSLWRPEYGAYMIEGTPGKPYGGLLAHFNVVEANMRYRRLEVAEMLSPGEHVMSITNFPRLGCPNFTFPPAKPTPEDETCAARSLYFPDEAIFPGHPRFKTLTRNIRQRRGEKVSIDLPIFKDKNTVIPVEGSLPEKPDHVHMDAMGFGMGCCCLQLTFQACNITEARTLYDQLTPMCPIMLALTAASPAYRGYLTDVDCRWNVISASVDCRTREEKGEIPLKNDRFRINKSRYDSIDSYLSPAGEKYNDVPLVMDEALYKRLREGDIDHLLAQHIAHLFIRDSVSLFSEKVHQNDKEDTDHFENIQSTNWQTMRFKPPPPNSPIGWRVEFRPCEAQLTDFENAAIVCFVVLLTRVILSYQLDFLIPISKVDENMQTSQKRGAVLTEKFWFKKNINGAKENNHSNESNGLDAEYELMTIDQIINGKGCFPGLVPLINSYLGSMDVDADTHCTIQQYLKLIQKRASGELLTTASWIRKEITEHEEYKHDSVVSERICYDLLKKGKDIQDGIRPCPELLGANVGSKTADNIPPAIEKHLTKHC